MINTSHTTNTHMYHVMNNNTIMATTDDLSAAILLIKTLETGLDTMIKHSPYTILRAETSCA